MHVHFHSTGPEAAADVRILETPLPAPVDCGRRLPDRVATATTYSAVEK